MEILEYGADAHCPVPYRLFSQSPGAGMGEHGGEVMAVNVFHDHAALVMVLKIVKDPWLPLVYTGIWMMIAGAVCMFTIAGKRKEENV